MASQLPQTMKALAIKQYTKPENYEVLQVPVPALRGPQDVLVKVHSASINPVDVKFASGLAKLMISASFPYVLGYDLAGTVAAVGSEVTNVKVGDEVYSRVPEDCRGTVAEYALTTSATVAKKPKSLSFTDSASIPLAGMTALQALEWADKRLEGGIKGKTVLIPGGLSGTGIFAVQLAKSVFGAAKVITTLSTAKIQKAKELWGEEGIQYVDYSKSDVVSAVGKGTVDYFFDSMGTGSEYSPLVKRGGVCVSISSLPSGDTMAKNAPELPWLVKQGLNAADWWLSRKFTAAGIQYTYIFMEPSGKELEQFSQWVDEGKITTLVGQTAKLDDIAAVRKGCQQIYDAKGGIGKFVIDVISIE